MSSILVATASYLYIFAGELATVDGVRVYIAKPPGDYPKDKAILFLSDVFGLQLINNKV